MGWGSGCRHPSRCMMGYHDPVLIIANFCSAGRDDSQVTGAATSPPTAVGGDSRVDAMPLWSSG